MEQVRAGTVEYTEERKIGLRLALEEREAAVARNAEREKEAKRLEEVAAEYAAAVVEAAREQAQAYRDQLVEAQAVTAGYGLSQAALEAVESTRLRDAAATLQQRAAAMQASDPHAELVRLWRDQAAALRGIAEQRDILAQQKELDRVDPLRGASQGGEGLSAGEATRAAVGRGASLLEDTLVDTLASGRLNVRGFVDYAIQEFLRLQVIRPFMQNLLGGAGSLLSLLSGGGGGVGINGDAGITPVGPGLAAAKSSNVVLNQTVNVQGDVSRRQIQEITAGATAGAVNTIAQSGLRGNPLGAA